VRCGNAYPFQQFQRGQCDVGCRTKQIVSWTCGAAGRFSALRDRCETLSIEALNRRSEALGLVSHQQAARRSERFKSFQKQRGTLPDRAHAGSLLRSLYPNEGAELKSSWVVSKRSKYWAMRLLHLDAMRLPTNQSAG
jgi:hypothetical protein